ncbi:MAG: hypothetical protein EOM19_01430 [Candidatus Moranbacteria bacterium]|nr:hypothetical protein [Candidatus Moranbacteria bacterium]
MALSWMVLSSMFTHGVLAGNTATQTIHIQIMPFSVIGLEGSRSSESSFELDAEIGISSNLVWTTNEENVSIFVSSPQEGEMQTQCEVIKGNGQSQGWIDISSSPQALVRGIRREIGACRMSFRSESTPNKTKKLVQITILSDS